MVSLKIMLNVQFLVTMSVFCVLFSQFNFWIQEHNLQQATSFSPYVARIPSVQWGWPTVSNGDQCCNSCSCSFLLCETPPTMQNQPPFWMQNYYFLDFHNFYPSLEVHRSRSCHQLHLLSRALFSTSNMVQDLKRNRQIPWYSVHTCMWKRGWFMKSKRKMTFWGTFLVIHELLVWNSEVPWSMISAPSLLSLLCSFPKTTIPGISLISYWLPSRNCYSCPAQ